jgi:Uma2 family endonuclease
MIAFGVPNHNRTVYKLWQEKQFPQVIFEVASSTTWKTDIGDKVEDYGRLGAEEYYLLDPENDYLPLPLMAYRRDETGRLRLVLSPRLDLEIVWENERFRLFDPTNQEFLLTTEELKAELDELRRKLN